VLAGAAFLSSIGCEGIQSALNPAGRGAERIAQLFWWMTAGGLCVWVAVAALTLYAALAPAPARLERRSALLIIGGGAILPVFILAVLLAYGLAMIPDLVATAPAGSLRIAVTGEQWWWRVRYLREGSAPVELANEVRLPVGQPVEFVLISADVIHSFWIPSLAGKMDMFPGRPTRLLVEPTRTGVFRAACAEYCGASHALMSFYAVVGSREEFDRWLEHQARPAQPPAGAAIARGERLFLTSGCPACHTIRGSPAKGLIGPDLTHVGSRLSIAAGILKSNPENHQKWIARSTEIKPEARMPAFAMLTEAELSALAAYLDGLQ
jgi:cytochrome c oxidase subunit 2